MDTENLFDDSGFEPSFTREETLEQHCHLLETEMAELLNELRAARRRIAALVGMWSRASADLKKAEKEVYDLTWALSAANLELSKIATSKLVARHTDYTPGAGFTDCLPPATKVD